MINAEIAAKELRALRVPNRLTEVIVTTFDAKDRQVGKASYFAGGWIDADGNATERLAAMCRPEVVASISFEYVAR